ncbi:MAG: hypothetical protein AB7U79_06445 [Candidatus Izemoplasmatales bacterium]
MKCEYCQKEMNLGDRFCSHCGMSPTKKYIDYQASIIKKQQNEPLIKWIIGLTIAFVFPIGVPLMWMLEVYTLKTRVIVTLAFVISSLLGFIMIIVWTTSPGYLY